MPYLASCGYNAYPFPTPRGLYRHYKGNVYRVLDTVRHSETLEPMTLYQALYGEQGLWVRPAAMFEQQVVTDGLTQARFTKIEDENGVQPS